MRVILLLVCLTFSSLGLFSQGLHHDLSFELVEFESHVMESDRIVDQGNKTVIGTKLQAFVIKRLVQRKQENPKLISSLLTVALGVFGVHRLYLGTDIKVPIFYTLTLGGGFGVLPFIDLLVILFSNDLERYTNNTRIFMWLVD